MNVLGISAFYHDSAACLVCDGEILAAAQEERFTRKKHDSGFPTQAIRYCLEEGGIVYGKGTSPFAKRCIGRDPLRLKRRPVQSYWLEHKERDDVSSYFRQA